MDDATFFIRFPEASSGEGSVHAQDLAAWLCEEVSPDLGFQTEIRRRRPNAQDFGATLAVILGTSAITAIAKGIEGWLKGHTGVSMEIVTPSGLVVVRNVESRAAAEIVK